MLTDTQVRELYANGRFAPAEWAEWQKNYADFLAWVRAQSDAELSSPASQERLWKARAITPVGPGESVNVTGAYTDPDVVDGFVALRKKSWPADPTSRAEAIQEEGERLLRLVRERHSKRQPYAKLWRAFAALLPAEFHCVFRYEAHVRAAKLLLPEGSDPSHVLIRARLREALGNEDGSVTEHVRRSTFCWWLHEQFDAISSGATPTTSVATSADRISSPLALWPYGKQFKGNSWPKNGLELYRRTIQECLPGIPRADLVEVLRNVPEFSTQSPGALRVYIARIAGLGLLQTQGDTLRPTDAGESLLESDVPDVLVERLIERVFPFGGLLRFLAGGPRATGEINKHLQTLYPNWKENMGPSQLTSWAKHLDLMEPTTNARYQLTPYGEGWEKRLPSVLPMAPAVAAAEEDSEPQDTPGEGATEAEKKNWPSFEQLRHAFTQDPAAKTFVLEDRQLRTLHLAWHCNPQRRFVLLAGLSGTGKTAVIRQYARLYCQALNLPLDKHLAVVPVSPDWRDPTGMVGYLNALHAEPTFQAEPALRLVLRAVSDSANPYFLVLDEMNLARAEQYFAPFLSAMEQDHGRLHFHGHETAVNEVPPSVPWPKNLFIAGTVNMDETTHPFSDKVLDRAFTLEFWDVDLKSFFSRQTRRQPEVEQVLTELHGILKPSRRHFGYRTAGEVLAFVAAMGGDIPNDLRAELVDQAVFSKVLPRIRGEHSLEFEAMLQELRKLCASRSLPRSADKVEQMEATLKTTGITRFWS
ncbi:McrB family protein [Myxococcus sp. RHSTA-1-4]|uniref:McrB family protein n=1 Tax=Myxococcus sp. RHSTA-1-4 TaxID=2874601 RepID=UPI001CBC774E|nr:AAA family ATPase [Myxococcus sp. RHSTA-1-4]MBZ4419949.1 ATP-binding protein [Myxococcus sp. RHSTA-1-4]